MSLTSATGTFSCVRLFKSMRRKRTRHKSKLYILHLNGFWYINDNYSILKKKSFFEHSSCSFYPPVWLCWLIGWAMGQTHQILRLLATVFCKISAMHFSQDKSKQFSDPSFCFFDLRSISCELCVSCTFCRFAVLSICCQASARLMWTQHKGDAFISRIHLLKSFTEIICQRENEPCVVTGLIFRLTKIKAD